MNILNLTSNFIVNAKVAGDSRAISCAQRADEHAGKMLRAQGAGDRYISRSHRALCFRNLKSARDFLSGALK